MNAKRETQKEDYYVSPPWHLQLLWECRQGLLAPMAGVKRLDYTAETLTPSLLA